MLQEFRKHLGQILLLGICPTTAREAAGTVGLAGKGIVAVSRLSESRPSGWCDDYSRCFCARMEYRSNVSFTGALSGSPTVEACEGEEGIRAEGLAGT